MKVITVLLFVFMVHNSVAASKIVYIKGRVYSKGKTARINQTVGQGDKVSTGKGSLAIITLDGGSKIKISESSELIVQSVNLKRVTTFLSAGQAFFKVVKSKIQGKKKQKFFVKTKTALMGVRGTEFFVAHGKQKTGDIWMCVNEGVVVVRAKTEKKSKTVKEGEGIVIKGGKDTSRPRPLAWTKKLNWQMNPKKGNLVNNLSIEAAYFDVLDFDYD